MYESLHKDQVPLRKRISISNECVKPVQKKRKSELNVVQEKTEASAKCQQRHALRHKTEPISLLNLPASNNRSTSRQQELFGDCCHSHALCYYLHSQHKKTDLVLQTQSQYKKKKSNLSQVRDEAGPAPVTAVSSCSCSQSQRLVKNGGTAKVTAAKQVTKKAAPIIAKTAQLASSKSSLRSRKVDQLTSTKECLVSFDSSTQISENKSLLNSLSQNKKAFSRRRNLKKSHVHVTLPHLDKPSAQEKCGQQFESKTSQTVTSKRRHCHTQARQPGAEAAQSHSNLSAVTSLLDCHRKEVLPVAELCEQFSRAPCSNSVLLHDNNRSQQSPSQPTEKLTLTLTAELSQQNNSLNDFCDSDCRNQRPEQSNFEHHDQNCSRRSSHHSLLCNRLVSTKPPLFSSTDESETAMDGKNEYDNSVGGQSDKTVVLQSLSHSSDNEELLYDKTNRVDHILEDHCHYEDKHEDNVDLDMTDYKKAHYAQLAEKGKLSSYESIILQSSPIRSFLNLYEAPNAYNMSTAPFDALMSERCPYLSVQVICNIRDANRFVPVHNYFELYRDCPSANRVSPATRRAILTFFIEIGRSIPSPISDFSLHMAINCFDRFLSCIGQLPNGHEEREEVAKEIEAVGAACLLLCSKLEDVWTLSLGDLCKTFDQGSDSRKADILKWELDISERLQFEISTPTVFDFLHKMVAMTLPHVMQRLEQEDNVLVCNGESEDALLLAAHGASAEFVTNAHICESPRMYSLLQSEQDINDTLMHSAQKLNKHHKFLSGQSDPRSQPLEHIIGGKHLGWSSPSYFEQTYYRASNLSQELSQKSNGKDLAMTIGLRLFAHAAAYSETVIFHHTALGIPVHLIAAVSLLFAMVRCCGGEHSISLLPESVRLMLGADQYRLQETLRLFSAILEERQVFYSHQTPKHASMRMGDDVKQRSRHSLYSMTTASSYRLSSSGAPNYLGLDDIEHPFQNTLLGRPSTADDPAVPSPLSRLLLLLPAATGLESSENK